MNRRTPRTHRAIAVALTAAALFTAGTGAALADSVPSATASPTTTATPSTTAHGPSGDGARALCRRAPKVERRIDRALKRLDAGPGVRGSIARLQQRVDNADEAGHDAVRTYLDDRLTFRRSLVPTLHQRQQDLGDVRAWCRSHHDGKQED